MKLLVLLSLCCLFILSCTSDSGQEDKSSNKEVNNLTKGKKLFLKHCSECHDKGMELTMTAPPLCVVVKKRSPKWIKEYTLKGTGKARQEGDSIALEIEKEGWGEMPSFDYLPEKEVDNILLYINTFCSK